MAAYESLLGGSKLVQITPKPAKAKPAKKLEGRGCKFCPSNDKKGINKIFGKVRGKDLFIVGTFPGRDENIEEKEFVGKSGKFLWHHLKSFGIRRKDVDVQNVVRCFPTKLVDGDHQVRDPYPQEFHCCSLYTDKALKKSKAKVYIIFGEKAQKQFLGKEYKKTRKIFWSDRLQAKVYCLYHPSYFVRGMFPQNHLDDWLRSIEAVSADLKGDKKHSRSSYLEEQDYQAITTVKRAEEVEKILLRAADKKIRISLDTEFDKVDGKKQIQILCASFTYKPGQSFVFIVDHPLVREVRGEWKPLRKKVRHGIREVVKRLVANQRVKKVLHHGSSDVRELRDAWGVKLAGYAFDTNYSEYLANPNRRGFGIASIAADRFPRFGEYKNIIFPYALPHDVQEKFEELKVGPTDYAAMAQLSKTHGLRMSQVPLHNLVLRCGADSDITKRIELATKSKVSLPLLRIYRDASFILDDMTPNGPAFDFAHNAKLKKYYPPKAELTYDKLKQIAGNSFKMKVLKKVKNSEKYELIEKEMWNNESPQTEFNPGSPDQVRVLLFYKLKIDPPATAFNDKKGFPKKPEIVRKKYGFYARMRDGRLSPINPGTGKKVMELLARKHEVAQLMMEYRRLSKIESTYLDSYESCAKANDGLLRTKWWLTGTSTGRLSSGGGKEQDEQGNEVVVNLQNVHGDPNLKNQVVADPEWKKLYDAIHKAIRKSGGTALLKKIADVQARLARVPQYARDSKEKRKALEGELFGDNGYITRLLKLLDNSKRFGKLCKRIIRLLGYIKVLLGYDQGQVEVRMMGQASGDKNLIRDCKAGDIHSQVGHAMTGWSIQDIKKDKKTRTLTKNIHFGILFGLSAAGLMDFILAKDPDNDITEEKAREYYENYFRAYPGVRKFVEDMRAFVEQHGFVDNMFGFRRPLGNASMDEEFRSDDDGDNSDGGGAYWGNQAINCLDYKTEALTQRGWVKGFNLAQGDILLTKNPKTNQLEWQSATDVKQWPDYDKPIMLFESRSFNAASTLDHRWLTGNGKEYLTKDITQDKHIHRTGEYTGPSTSIYNDDFIRLMGWYLTDGYSRKRGGWYGGHGFSLCQSNRGNPKKVAMIDALVSRLRDNGFKVRTKLRKNRSQGEVFWHFSGGLASAMHGMCPNRTLSPQFLSHLTREQLDILLHTMVLGDGTGSKLSSLTRLTSKTKISFCAGKKKQIDAFQMLCMMTGRACNVKKRDMSKYINTQKKYKSMENKPKLGIIWEATVLRRTVAHVYPEHKRMIKNKGVWCPMVPNTFFVARRKGQVFITGNTPIQGAAHCLMLMAMAIMKRKRKKYGKLLPTLEIHDYMGFKTPLRDVLELFSLGKHLLEKEPLKLIRKEYPDIKWLVPLVVEGVIGLRLGDSIEAEEDGKLMSMPMLLAKMFLESYQKECRLEADLQMVA